MNRLPSSHLIRFAALTLILVVPACGGGGGAPTALRDAGRDAPARLASGSGSGGSVRLQVTRNGTGSGTVTSSPSGINCGSSCSKSFSSGTTVTLTATPASGSTFAGWSGGGCSGTGPCTTRLSSNTTVTATFNTAGSPPPPPPSGGPAFTTSTLPDGNVGADYSAFITTNGGGGGQDQFRIVAGSLPDGLQMAPFHGVQSTVISGRPTRTQTSSFTVEVSDEGGSSTQAFSITIGPPVTLAITLPGPVAKSGTAGTFYFQNLFASGGATPYTWSITGGQLPPGLRVIKASNGNRIEGTPTTRGTFLFDLTVRDAGGQQATQQTSITIN